MQRFSWKVGGSVFLSTIPIVSLAAAHDEAMPTVPEFKLSATTAAPGALELATPGRLKLQRPSFEATDSRAKVLGDTSPALEASVAPSSADAKPGGPPQPIDLGLVPIDYNLSDPNRGALNHLRALGGVMVSNYINWQFAWLFMDMAFVTRDTIARNFRLGFIWDDNSLQTNFFRHPYQGSMYYHSARAAGLSFWESTLWTAFGSMQWEFMGETHPPAPNDFYTTTFGGIALGEVLYRLSSEILDDSSSGGERALREIGSTLVAPMRTYQRLTSGQTWTQGPPHQNPSSVDVELDFGVERVRSSEFANLDEYDPSFLFALNIEYGDQLPTKHSNTFEPYDFFDTYLSATLFNSELSGGRIFVSGVLHGWNQWLGDPEELYPDNNIVGFVQSFDYANANLLELGSTGLGMGDWLNLRFGEERDFRLSADLQWQAMSGASSPFTQSTGRTYNFGMGGAATLRTRLRLAPYGELSLFGKQYVVAVVDGEDGSELYGLFRATYEIPIYHGVGLGFAPTYAYRVGVYSHQQDVHSNALETQAYLLWRP